MMGSEEHGLRDGARETTRETSIVALEGPPLIERAGLMGPLLFPRREGWDGARILHVGVRWGIARAMAAEYAGAEVFTTGELPDPDAEGGTGADPPVGAVTAVTLDDGAIAAHGPYTLIAYDSRADHLAAESGGVLRVLLDSLAPDGVLVASYPARLARTGLLAGAEIARRLAPYAPDMPPAELVRRALRAVPRGHHFRLRNEFSAELAAGGDAGCAKLLSLRPEDLASVPEVLDRVAEAGGHFAGWLFPSSYDPTQCVSDPEARAVLAALPEPRRSTVCELLTAHPTVHHALVTRTPDALVRPPWGEAGLLDWRPVRLPVYAWPELHNERGVCALHPAPRTEFTGQVPLAPWHARAALAADGERTARDLLALPEVRRAFDLAPDRWEDAMGAFLEQAYALRALALRPPD